MQASDDRRRAPPMSTVQDVSETAREAPSLARPAVVTAETTTIAIILGVSVSHMLNDMMQSLAPALYPVFRNQFALTFFQTGLITFVFQVTASLLQPLIGLYTDRRPKPFSLPVAMVFTVLGLAVLAYGQTYSTLLIAVALIGVGSAIFHPGASRVARAASGGRHGLAQSLFQVGGNFGQSLGPLMAAFIVVPFGQHSVLAFTVLALAAMILLTGVSRWYAVLRAERRKAPAASAPAHSRRVVARTLFVLAVMLFSKVLYLASINSYYTFYLIQTFGLSIQASQVLLFVFLASVAAGTFLGGPLVDRFGAKFVIWGSILGVLPFTLLLPHLGLVGTVINTVAIGLIISSAFSAMIVYAQELTPGNVGAVEGLFFGLSFGLGGLGAALLGILADKTSLTFVYHVCAFLPAVGLLGGFLPSAPGKAVAAKRG